MKGELLRLLALTAVLLPAGLYFSRIAIRRAKREGSHIAAQQIASRDQVDVAERGDRGDSCSSHRGADGGNCCDDEADPDGECPASRLDHQSSAWEVDAERAKRPISERGQGDPDTEPDHA